MSRLMLRLKISLAERLNANKLDWESPLRPYGLGGGLFFRENLSTMNQIFSNLYAYCRRDDRPDQFLDVNRQYQVFQMLGRHNEFGRRVLIELAD